MSNFETLSILIERSGLSYEGVPEGVLEALQWLRGHGFEAPIDFTEKALEELGVSAANITRLRKLHKEVGPGQIAQEDGGQGVGLFVILCTKGNLLYANPPTKIVGLFRQAETSMTK